MEQYTNESYTIAWICALPIEQAAAQGMLDERHMPLSAAKGDTNNYRFGRISGHNVVIAVLKSGAPGTTPAAVAANDLLRSFPNIRFGLMVGVGGGVPRKLDKKDIRLGDVVVSNPSLNHGGVVQYDLGKSTQEGKFIQIGSLNRPPPILATAVAGLRGDAQLDGYQIQHFVNELTAKYPDSEFDYPEEEVDRLFSASYAHAESEQDCARCEEFNVISRGPRKNARMPTVHYGLIGSANRVLRDAELRDRLAQELGIVCFEMEAGGLMNDFPCLVTRGICDYCDSHKNKQWQPYAAATAAAYAKELLGIITPLKVAEERLAREVTDALHKNTEALDHLSNVTRRIDAKMDLSGLPTVPSAAFDSHADYDEEDSTCLLGTRLGILQQIRNWITASAEKSVFWLNGMAGTGKTTIARSIAQESANQNQLGASFFFRRGDGDRELTKYLFTTLAGQLAQSLPVLQSGIAAALREDPNIGYKALAEQFEKLVFLPFETFGHNLSLPVLIVIDALDECSDQDKVQKVVKLLTRLHTIKTPRIRILLTSRREQALEWAFEEASDESFKEIALHEISETSIEQDIARYFDFKFHRIVAKTKQELPAGWPDPSTLCALTTMSSPLFIVAATLCRFIGDYRSDPVQRLQNVLERKQTTLDKVRQTYQTILESLLQVPVDEQKDVLASFHSIVGAVLVLVEPLSIPALSALLNIDDRKVILLLRQLRSVLRVSTDLTIPIRTFHASFGDFVLNKQWHEHDGFWIDACTIHNEIAARCLDLLLSSPCLSRQDICDLRTPGLLRERINLSLINDRLPSEIQYACRYWIRHLVASRISIATFEQQISTLFEERFLIWFEALSLLGAAHEMISTLSELLMLFKDHQNPRLTSVLIDTRRFALANSFVADVAPLQLYTSGTIFAPKHSLVRENAPKPTWLKQWPKYQTDWGSLLQTLEGHSQPVKVVEFSFTNDFLFSVSTDGTIKIWHPITGQLLQTIATSLTRMKSGSVAVSHGSGLLAWGAADATIKIWDIASGQPYKALYGSLRAVESVVFSLEDDLLASSSTDSTINIWDVSSGKLLKTFSMASVQVDLIKFLSDGRLLASGSDKGSVTVWNIYPDKPKKVVEEYARRYATAFSPDGSLLAFWSPDYAKRFITIWDIASKRMLQSFDESVDSISSMVFSPDNKLLACGSFDHRVRVWIINSGSLQHTFEGHTNGVWSVAFSSDGELLASASEDHMVKTWDLAAPSVKRKQSPRRHLAKVSSVAFSPDSRLLASGSYDSTIKLWNIDAGSITLLHTNHSHSQVIHSAVFSPDGKTLVSTSEDGTIRVWNLGSDRIRLQQTLDEKCRSFYAVTFSPDGELLASGEEDGTTKLWRKDSEQWKLRQSFKSSKHGIDAIAISPNSKLLATGSNLKIDTWDISLQVIKQSIDTNDFVDWIAFHPGLQLLETNLGRFQIDNAIACTSSQQTENARFGVYGSWLVRDGKRFLWLPPDCRASFDQSKGLVALGSYSGSIVLLDIDNAELDGIVL